MEANGAGGMNTTAGAGFRFGDRTFLPRWNRINSHHYRSGIPPLSKPEKSSRDMLKNMSGLVEQHVRTCRTTCPDMFGNMSGLLPALVWTGFQRGYLTGFLIPEGR